MPRVTFLKLPSFHAENFLVQQCTRVCSPFMMTYINCSKHVLPCFSANITFPSSSYNRFTRKSIFLVYYHPCSPKRVIIIHSAIYVEYVPLQPWQRGPLGRHIQPLFILIADRWFNGLCTSHLTACQRTCHKALLYSLGRYLIKWPSVERGVVMVSGIRSLKMLYKFKWRSGPLKSLSTLLGD